MAHTHTFEFGTAELFLDSERSYRQGDPSRGLPTHTVTLFVKKPGDMFHSPRSLAALQRRVRRAVENVAGASIDLVNSTGVVIFHRGIRSYSDAVDVATEVVAAFQEQHKQLIAAEKANAKKLKQRARRAAASKS